MNIKEIKELIETVCHNGIAELEVERAGVSENQKGSGCRLKHLSCIDPGPLCKPCRPTRQPLEGRIGSEAPV